VKTIVIINTDYARQDVEVEFREDVAKGDVRFETRPDMSDLPWDVRDGLRQLDRIGEF